MRQTQASVGQRTRDDIRPSAPQLGWGGAGTTGGGAEPARQATARSVSGGSTGPRVGDGSGVVRVEVGGGGAVLFFSRSRFKSEAAAQTCGREKGGHGYDPYYIPRLIDEYTYPIFVEVHLSVSIPRNIVQLYSRNIK
jgi:hypothetical protein